jgi:hypothetical protein
MNLDSLLALRKLSNRKGGTIMAGKKSSTTATAHARSDKEPTKAQLQRRMEAAREEITETVEEIKDTVVDQYESVKETVTEAFDWRAQFRKHSVAFSLGALAVGYVVGSGIAAAIKDATPKRGRKDDGFFAELAAVGEVISEELSGVAQTLLLPALVKKVKDAFGIDLSDRLLAAKAANRTTRSSKRSTKHSAAKKSSRKGGAKKSASRKRAAKKSSAK